ncbi:MAG: 3-hydroxyacyl-[acyl-carrier-protein] dehydratase FabZ [Gammaproteobacteria bacterium]|nr:3-hydroxyacyl-[acyl-carrier-protein] dehydratase FabZ [Gammaproteobacteria bacterium]
MDIHRIREILPHRYPFLLIDRVVEHTPGESLTALKNVTVNEPFFEGHFPYRPVFPGVLMLESIAQASAILVSLIIDAKASQKNVYLFAGVDKARFKAPVEPGDQLMITVRLEAQKRALWRCAGQIEVDGKTVCASDVLFTHRPIE